MLLDVRTLWARLPAEMAPMDIHFLGKRRSRPPCNCNIDTPCSFVQPGGELF
jgi:hypothetical protein